MIDHEIKSTVYTVKGASLVMVKRDSPIVSAIEKWKFSQLEKVVFHTFFFCFCPVLYSKRLGYIHSLKISLIHNI